MDPNIKELIEKLSDLAGHYRKMAEKECKNGDAFSVYRMIKESIACETKVRAIRNQYSQYL